MSYWPLKALLCLRANLQKAQPTIFIWIRSPTQATSQKSRSAQIRSVQRRQGSVTAPVTFPIDGVTAPQFALLVDDSSDDTGTYRTPAFTNREAQTVVHRNRTD
uniref:Uncharacterized protein n=1 Tax=uncultured gamma proteobacterium HF0010_01E20 TaxID=710977 RepID=E0XQ75_9GAMM|nr:hypothetical protein [uncultured gamma proteobacterium HF0010_01E20]